MKVAFFTLFEGNYERGVGALLNSLSSAGFDGTVHLFSRGHKPIWIQSKLGGLSVMYRQISPERHLGYHKPFIAADLFREDESLEGVVYADPDVLVLCPWAFIKGWLQCGVALCSDSNITCISPHHPWRRVWSELLKATSREPLEDRSDYYHNSGFFGIHRRQEELLRVWCELTVAFAQRGGDTTRFFLNDRCRAVTGDQDLLAAALMGCVVPVATLGSEGMGFNGFYFILSHAIESPKPWSRCFIASALRGTPPTMAARLWLSFTNTPVKVLSLSVYWRTKGDLWLATLISRFWKR